MGGHVGGESSEEMLLFIIFTLGELSLSFAVIDDRSSLDLAHSIRCILFFLFFFLPHLQFTKRKLEIHNKGQ